MTYLRLLGWMAGISFIASLLCSIVGVLFGCMLVCITHAARSSYAIDPLAVGGWFCLVGFVAGIGIAVKVWIDWEEVQ